ncbi:MAG: hypothetical protein KF884_05680 [Fimbriimonadaceae bacterium]|nr:hypothetical protein [Fimbriimonadaceae bacterium]QYK59575.1 MAG: hypothetical protein KF884_05680 [Fimbriimonadaceae bacterium]
MPLSLLVKSPPAGHLVGLQRGKGSSAKTEAPVRTTGDDLSFDLALEYRDGRFRGPFLQQDGKGQFIYLRWGVSAGDLTAVCDRRTKVYLGLVTPEAVASAAKTGRRIVLAFDGAAKDGFPACATVKVTLG